ncbi:unnamed protein product [Adineta steineri]|uniref:CD109 antigen n=1 Tax=Adineta steineri TaxID=433720 RepID=A0A813RGW5_9BILA|nr:unnamed protein product [Adineta steineri]CAF0922095.1 unnamed protein product [Adineta steineri]
MFKIFLICINLCTVLTNSNQTDRLRRQSPFADGIQPPLHKHEPRWVLPTHAHRKSEPNYMIVGPKIVRPSDIVSVWVTILNKDWSVTNVAVSLFNRNDEIAANEQSLIPEIPTAVVFQVPQSAPNGTYRIYIRGTLPNGHVVFYNETNVIFHPKSLSIFIQLEKPMYRHEQLVKFRCIPVYSDLRGYFSTVDAYLIGPMNNILRRWHNLQTTWGYVELSYQFASFIAFGTYTIRCEAQQSVNQKEFLVDFFLQKKIEVNVSLPFFINVESSTINGIVTANYTTGRGVVGLMRLTVRLKDLDESFEPAVNIIPVPDAPGPKLDYPYKSFIGRSDFAIPISEAVREFGDLVNRELIFTATVFDPLWNETTNSSFLTSFYKTEYRIKFLNRQSGVFKPQMTYTLNIAVLNGDQSRFRVADFNRNTTYVRIQTNFDVGPPLASVDHPIPDDALVKHAFIIPNQNQSMYMSIRAELFINNEFIQTAFIEQRSVRYRSPSQTYIQITTSTRQPRIDNYMIFTVNVSRYCSHVHYHIISASRIVYTDTIQMLNSRQQTVYVAVTRRMAPSAHILAYFIDYTGELVADVIHFHVSITSDTVALNLTLNQRKDLTGDTVELLAYGPAQARVAFSGTEYAQYQLYGGNDILEMDIYNELYEYDAAAHPSPNITWYSNFLTPSEKVYRVGQSIAANVYRVFRSAGLFLLTDIDIVIDEEQEEKFCMELGNRFTCNDGSCYTISEKCDGIFNCLDGADELDCPEKSGPSFTPINKRLWPYWERLFQLSIAWESVSSYPDGRAQLTVGVPDVIGTWMVSAFSISQQNGLSVLPSVVTFEGTRQFFISVEIPGKVRLGEQIGARVDVFNFQTHRIEALIILHASPNYRFINIDQSGQASSFAPRTSEGHHHVLLILYPSSSRRIHLPILPLTVGSIDVIIEGITGVKQDIETKTIEVVYEGITNHYSTSTLISLENTPRQMYEFDIIVPENYILPLQNYLIYVPGSPKANMYISGDVAGPYFWEGSEKALTSDNLIYKTVAAAEGALIGFATMVYDVIYLRQGHGGKGFDQSKLIQLLDLANIEYNRLMAFYFDDQSDMGIHDGAFSNFGWKNETSVWLTSWVLIALKDASQAEWETHNLFIDPRVRAKSSRWVMTRQNEDGSWKEHSNILDREKFQSLLHSIDTDLPLNLSLTAQAIIALKMNLDINGLMKEEMTDAIDRGRNWLELHYHMIVDSFELAITTYALHVVNSPEKDKAFNMLINQQRTSSSGIYWSNIELPSNRAVFMSLNERLAPKYESELEAHAIASTSFALLTYIKRAQTSLGKPIVHWLQTRRNFVAGWCSSYDSFFALKSLVNYAIRYGDTIQQYNLRVNLSSSDDAYSRKFEPILITDDNIIDVQQRSIESVYGRVFIDAYGTGYALMQMKVEVNVEYPELIRPVAYEAFQMSLNVHLSNKYNFSYLLYEPCVTWLPGLTKAGRSGWSIFTIEIPTGYKIEERYLKDLVGFGIVRNLRDAENYPNSLNFLFEFFDTTPICWAFELKRYIPVANMTRYYEMKAYEWHEPWSANRSMYTLRTLFGLDICSVCGSYQCPYCPYYAKSSQIQITLFIIIFFIVFQLFQIH